MALLDWATTAKIAEETGLSKRAISDLSKRLYPIC